MFKVLKDAKFLFFHFLKCEFSAKGKFVSPLLFAGTLLVIFNFAFCDIMTSDQLSTFLLSEIFVTILFSSQMSFMRLFDLDNEDKAVDVLKAEKLSSTSLFLGKYFLSIFHSFSLVVPTFLLALVFKNYFIESLSLVLRLFFLIFLVLIGLCSLGSLLANLLGNLNSREVLFPLFFYPLCTPFFILGLELSKTCLETGELDPNTFVLLGLSFIFFSLGFLLFDDVLE